MYVENDAVLGPRLSPLTLLSEPDPVVQLDDMFERDDDTKFTHKPQKMITNNKRVPAG